MLRRLRPLVGGSYLVVGGGFMFCVAVFKTPEERFVTGIVLASGVALFVLGVLEITSALRRRRSLMSS
jgi:hypothetical protein